MQLKEFVNSRVETIQSDDTLQRAAENMRDLDVGSLPVCDGGELVGMITIGSYEIQDFILYYTIRFGYLPSKIAFLCYCSWKDRNRGLWPDSPAERRNQYTLADIKHWLSVFAWRFFQLSQFKRSCIPNAPKVGSGGSLSPRGDYRAPSDGEATAWLEQIKRIPDSDPELNLR
jgi:NAD+ synthase (glutamine-hydrolysing)